MNENELKKSSEPMDAKDENLIITSTFLGDTSKQIFKGMDMFGDFNFGEDGYIQSEETQIPRPKKTLQLTDTDVRKGIEQGTLQQEEMIVEYK